MSLRNRADPLYRSCRGHDLDVLKPSEIEQMCVTRYDQIGLCSERRGEHVIVGRVANDSRRDGSWRNDRHERCVTVEDIAHRETAPRQLACELFA